MSSISPAHSLSSPLSRFRPPPPRRPKAPAASPTATTPGSFALAPDIGGPLMFASPDTPGMPAPSEKTAWDFLPDGWSVSFGSHPRPETRDPKPDAVSLMFTNARGVPTRITHPPPSPKSPRSSTPASE